MATNHTAAGAPPRRDGPPSEGGDPTSVEPSERQSRPEVGPRGASPDVAPRPPRRTRHELRRLLVEAGAQLLWQEGLAAGAEHVTFKRVFDHLERTSGVRVTHASVIGRIWQNQEEFQTEVLTNLAQLEIADVDVEVRSALTDLRQFDTSSPEARWRTAMEVCRLGGEATFGSLVKSKMWPRWMGIWALAVVDAGSPRKQPIVDALVRTEDQATDYYEASYAAAMG